MFGKGVHQQEEALLRDIVRSINKKLDHTVRESEGSRFILHVSLRNHQSDIILDMEELTAARGDMSKRHQIRQKIKAHYDHMDKSRYRDDILGLKPAKLLRASPKPQPSTYQRGFGRPGRR